MPGQPHQRSRDLLALHEGPVVSPDAQHALRDSGAGIEQAVALAALAAYDILFTAMAGSPSVLARVSIAMAAFFAIAIAGFRRSLPLVAGGLHRAVPEPGISARTSGR
jgi:hypothetical protein